MGQKKRRKQRGRESTGESGFRWSEPLFVLFGITFTPLGSLITVGAIAIFGGSFMVSAAMWASRPKLGGRTAYGWVDQLGKRDGQRHSKAQERLVSMGADAVPALREALGSDNSVVRLRAVLVLGELGPVAKDATSELIHTLENDNQRIQIEAAKALAAIGPDASAAGPALSKAIDSHNVHLAREALVAMGAVRYENALPVLTELVENSTGQKQLAALVALGRMGNAADKALLKVLAVALDPEAHNRGTAIESIGEIGTQADRMVPLFITMLLADVHIGRVCTALGKYGADAKPAIDTLSVMLYRSNGRVDAAVALGRIGAPAASTVSDILFAVRANFASVTNNYMAQRMQSPITTRSTVNARGEVLSRQTYGKSDQRIWKSVANAARNREQLMLRAIGEILGPEHEKIARMIAVGAGNARMEAVENLPGAGDKAVVYLPYLKRLLKAESTATALHDKLGATIETIASSAKTQISDLLHSDLECDRQLGLSVISSLPSKDVAEYEADLVDALQRAVFREDGDVDATSEGVVDSLVGIGRPVEKRILASLKHPDDRYRRLAVSILDRIGSDRNVIFARLHEVFHQADSLSEPEDAASQRKQILAQAMALDVEASKPIVHDALTAAPAEERTALLAQIAAVGPSASPLSDLLTAMSKDAPDEIRADYDATIAAIHAAPATDTRPPKAVTEKAVESPMGKDVPKAAADVVSRRRSKETAEKNPKKSTEKDPEAKPESPIAKSDESPAAKEKPADKAAAARRRAKLKLQLAQRFEAINPPKAIDYAKEAIELAPGSKTAKEAQKLIDELK